MPQDVTTRKRALRAQLRARRALHQEMERVAASEAIATRLGELVERLDARSVSCYLSTDTEPGTREFVADAVDRGVRVVVPVMRTDGRLDWAPWTRDTPLHTNEFGLQEPDGELLGPTAVDDVDLMIIPAAAVGADGARMGWGRGAFDRTLSAIATSPPVYAVLYDDELLDAVPSEAHDQPVSGVVTPHRTVTFSH